MRHISASVDRRRRLQQHLKTLNDLSTALGEKDAYTQAHGFRVAQYAMRLAGRLGYPDESIRQVGVGGLFHDVGKLALSDRIFSNREIHLSSDLQQEVRCHPLIGAALLKPLDFLGPVVDLVLFHHEREDGNGYPFGLKAGEIPPGAKIVSIADCFDAVTTDRPYQLGQSVEAAYDILRKGCRQFFCEAYVEVFIEEIDENGRILDGPCDPVFADAFIRSIASCGAR